jgi:hypothetical protein
MQVEGKVHRTKADRRTALRDLGLTEEAIIEAIKRANREAGRVVRGYHAKNGPGTILYHWIVFGLRAHRPKGWKVREHGGIPSILSPDGTRQVIVSSGDPNTGNELRPPKSRNPKGAETVKLVWRNRHQASLTEADDTELDDSWLSLVPDDELFDDDSVPNETWMLVYYLDERMHELRFELSKAVAMTDDMHFAILDDAPRIIFDVIKNPEPPTVAPEDEEQASVVNVQRRKA